jgi:hypothetical protein
MSFFTSTTVKTDRVLNGMLSNWRVEIDVEFFSNSKLQQYFP